MKYRLYLAASALALCGCVSSTKTTPAGQPSAYSVSFQKTDQFVALLNGGKTVWQFNYGKDLTKPYVHPLSLMDGTELTQISPPDHRWHYGLWFCWKIINGVNYWEEKTGKSEGTTEWDNVNVQTQPDGTARISMDVSYHESNKPAVLTEKRTLAFSAPEASGVYVLDWTSVFTAIADKVELNRTPIPGEKDGQPWGGYAGLSFRARSRVQDVLYTATCGPAMLTEGRFRGKDTGFEYSGIVDNKPFGVAILDHPQNLNAPTPWYLIHNDVMDFFSPAVISEGPYRISKGQTFTLQYRIFVHPGRWDSARLKKQYEQFTTIP